MKKVRTVLILVILSMFLSLESTAFQWLSHGDESDEGLTEVLARQLSFAEKHVLYNISNYHDSLDGEIIAGMPIIKLYTTTLHYKYADCKMDDLIDIAEGMFDYEYLVLNDHNVRVGIIKEGFDVYLVEYIEYPELTYADDLKSMSTNINILGNDCKIEEIYCFDVSTSYYGITIYFVTDKGTFVRYYEHEFSQGVWYSKDDFAKYATSFHRYISAPENNYDENGQGVGGIIPLSYYIDRIYGTDQDVNHDAPEQGLTPTIPQDTDKINANTIKNQGNFNVAYVIIPVAVIAAIGTVIVLTVSRKSRKKIKMADQKNPKDRETVAKIEDDCVP